MKFPIFILLAVSAMAQAESEVLESGAEPSAHPTFRMGLSGGSGDFGALAGFEFRAMLHDLLDTGHNRKHYGLGEIGHLRLSWQSSPSKVRFDELTLFRLGGFSPRDTEEEKEWSYFISLGLNTIRDSSCRRCLAGNIEGGWGASVSLYEDSPWLIYGLVSADFSLSSDFNNFVRVGIGPHLGIRWFLHRHWVLNLEGYYRYRIGSSYHHGHYARAELRWNMSRNFSVWFKAERFADGLEGRGGIFYYF